MRAISPGQLPEVLKNQMVVATSRSNKLLFLMFLAKLQAQLAE